MITINDQVSWWECRKSHLGEFLRDQCVRREWVVGEGELYGYIEEQRLPVDVQECLEGFHRGCVDYLSRQFAPK